ncbi:MAG: DUF1573 domain-containing protein [bacterium]|nr:DUF1573 domain-containing protein [bacterium]
MRRFIPILVILAALVAAATIVSAQGEESRPRAVPTEPIKDFEVVAKGEVIVHEFEIKNEGTATLEVTDVRPACGCTVAQYDKKIAPGATGKVKATVKTDHFGGPISKSIAVFTNDPEAPKLQLVVKANVKPYIAVVPGFARYNYVQGEPTDGIAQTLWATDGSEVEIVSVKAPYDHLKVNFREATEEERHPKGMGKQWRLEFDLDSQSPVGALRDYVEIRTNHPKQKVAKIPISGFVRPRQHITPPNVDFGQLEGAALPLQRTLHFTNFITDSIELTEVETQIEGLTAKVVDSDRDAGYRFKLVLTLSPEMPKGEFSSKVMIHTTDSQNPIIELPIKGTIL